MQNEQVYPNRVTCWYLLFLGSMMCMKQCVHLFQLQWHSCSPTSLTFSHWQPSTHSLVKVCTHVLVKHNRSHLQQLYLQAHTVMRLYAEKIISNYTFSSENIASVHLIVLRLWFTQCPEWESPLYSLWIPAHSLCGTGVRVEQGQYWSTVW